MHIVRVGRRYYNLEYLIVAEPVEPADNGEGGGLLVTMEPGKEYRLVGAEADEFTSLLGQALAPPPRPSSSGAVGHEVDPRTGDPLPLAPGRERKIGC